MSFLNSPLSSISQDQNVEIATIPKGKRNLRLREFLAIAFSIYLIERNTSRFPSFFRIKIYKRYRYEFALKKMSTCFVEAEFNLNYAPAISQMNIVARFILLSMQ